MLASGRPLLTIRLAFQVSLKSPHDILSLSTILMKTKSRYGIHKSVHQAHNLENDDQRQLGPWSPSCALLSPHSTRSHNDIASTHARLPLGPHEKRTQTRHEGHGTKQSSAHLFHTRVCHPSRFQALVPAQIWQSTSSLGALSRHSHSKHTHAFIRLPQPPHTPGHPYLSRLELARPRSHVDLSLNEQTRACRLISRLLLTPTHFLPSRPFFTRHLQHQKHR